MNDKEKIEELLKMEVYLKRRFPRMSSLGITREKLENMGETMFEENYRLVKGLYDLNQI